MKNTIKNTTIILVAAVLVFLSVGSAMAGNQSNGNSIYESGLDRFISQADNGDDNFRVGSVDQDSAWRVGSASDSDDLYRVG